ncbi:hypothetical protein [Helicobacter sp. 11S03491-1]|uniref:hypothetical protein n=1 Tax=Helicobacter sp. 11S03491-1 TaxID=1476196 RepID=UPI000BA662CB|nr:hypothetical protein [Helicobacter sp. 11S03491-1]PAF43709.1 hypothetical protein BKH45_00075 [Helicobacter sp. 11S03491-1]
MKKLILVFASILFLSSGFVYAKPTDLQTQKVVLTQNVPTLNDKDINLMFGDAKVNIMALDNDEMRHTQGFGF